MRESERYNEYELVYMILQGDEHSLQLLLHQYQPKINAIIKQNCTYQVMIRHHEGDLHQVAAAALMRAVLEYREDIHAEGTIVLLDLIESQRVEENGAFSIYRVTMEMQEEELRKSISELEYQIFCLRREGYSYREIAQRVNVTEKKVENTLMKLRRMLRGM